MAFLTEITGNLGTDRAAHLLRRATFGPTIAQINQFAKYTATEAMNALFTEPAQKPAPPIDPLTASTWVDPLEQKNAGESNMVSCRLCWPVTSPLDVLISTA